MNDKKSTPWPVRNRFIYVLALVVVLLGLVASDDVEASPTADHSEQVAVLVYHRFGESALDSMTLRVTTFEAQMRFLREHGYEIVRLRDVVDWLSLPDAKLPPKAVALTVDDGHRSVYDILRPIALREHIPFTLFVYPSAISNASYALTWEEIRQLQASGLFDVQSHTYWHPNFNIERARRAPADFHRFVERQLVDSRTRIESELGTPVDMLAWPFGIVDDDLMASAKTAGYRAALTIEGRPIDKQARLLALPRLLITDADSPAVLARRLNERDLQGAGERARLP